MRKPLEGSVHSMEAWPGRALVSLRKYLKSFWCALTRNRKLGRVRREIRLHLHLRPYTWTAGEQLSVERLITVGHATSGQLVRSCERPLSCLRELFFIAIQLLQQHGQRSRPIEVQCMIAPHLPQ